MQTWALTKIEFCMWTAARPVILNFWTLPTLKNPVWYRHFGPKCTLILRCSQNLGPKLPLGVWECYLNMHAVITALCPSVPLGGTKT